MGPVTDLPMRWSFWLPVWTLVAFVVVLSIWLIPTIAPVVASVPNGCVEIGQVNGAYVGFCVNPANGDEFYFGPGQIKFVE